MANSLASRRRWRGLLSWLVPPLANGIREWMPADDIGLGGCTPAGLFLKVCLCSLEKQQTDMTRILEATFACYSELVTTRRIGEKMTEIRRVELQCLNCKTWFPSPIQFGDTESFERSSLIGNRFGCPVCQTMVPCNKENMRHARTDGKGGWVGTDVR